MSFFHKKLQDVVDIFRENIPERGSKISKETALMEKRAYEEALAILDDHIKSELDEEKSLGGLATALKAYKEKVEEAKAILTKDFKTDWENITPVQYKKLGMNEPNFFRDLPKLDRTIKEARANLTTFQAILQKMLRDGKIELK